jgi:hypothetical protein
MARKEGVVFLFCTEARRGAPTISAKRLASARARQQKNSDQGPFEILVLQNSLGQAKRSEAIWGFLWAASLPDPRGARDMRRLVGKSASGAWERPTGCHGHLVDRGATTRQSLLLFLAFFATLWTISSSDASLTAV